jgi:hypothetical protein
MRRIVLASLVVVAAGCGGGDDEGGTASASTTRFCAFPAGSGDEGICLQLTGEPAAVNGSFQTQCADGGGTEVSSCPATDRIGRCTFTQAGVTVVEHYYPPLGASVGDACLALGFEWQPL